MSQKTLDEFMKEKMEEIKKNIIFYKETEFKETPIGKLPKDWKVVNLEKIAEIVNGYTFPIELQGKKEGKYPFIKVGDMNNSYKYIFKAENYVDDNDLKILRARVFPKGTIIFPKIGMAIKLNKFRILGCDALFDNNIAGLIPKNNISNEYLFYYFSGKINLISLASTTTVPSITKTKLKRLLVPLPPLEEQRIIAEILSTLDNAIEATEKYIEKLERLKRGLMQELLTKGIGHKEFKETPIGKIPKSWKIERLENIVDIFDNMRIPLSERERANRKGPYPYCGANGIIDYIDDYIFEGEYVLLAEDGGYYGPFETSAYIMDGKFWVNNHAHVLKAKENIALNKFLMYMLNFLDLRPYLVGSTRAKLNQKDMRKIKMPLPPLEEQKRIATILSTIDKWIELEKKRKEKLERLKRGLMDILLTGKIRIKVKGDQP